ncbi:MAG: VOC family protein [Betaproteobacteria bacterium]
MSNTLDHFMYAGRDLDELVSRFKSMSGVAAGIGGSHPGLGTRNALASLGDDVYLELIAPDPEQNIPGSWGDLFRTFEAPRIFTYIVRAKNLEGIQSTLAAEGIESDLVAASRKTPAGATLRWRLLLPRQNPLGDYIPKFIDWLDTPHPALTSVKGCTLGTFALGHPEALRLGSILRAVGINVLIERADRPLFRAQLQTPQGPLILSSGN